MRNEYHKELKQLHDEVTEMGALCERAVGLAVKAAATGDLDAAKEARETDKQIDHKEREIEALCMRLLLKQQPVAGEFRDVSAVLKVITDLERIGDQASDIAEIARFTEDSGAVTEDLVKMSAEVIRLVNSSICAFTTHDLELAHETITRDDEVDAWFTRVRRDLAAAMARDTEHGERWLDALMVAKYLERIADHATNVAEWAEFSMLGKRSKNGVFTG